MVRSWLICLGLGMVLSLSSPFLACATDIGNEDRITSAADGPHSVLIVAARGDQRHRPDAKKDPSIKKAPSDGQPAAIPAVQPDTRAPGSTDPSVVEARLKPDNKGPVQSPGNGKFKHLEIEVSHSQHFFKLLGKALNGGFETLHQCKVGLGSPGFPTPVGVYYVTHIYDDSPWWIPPPNRAWAAGQSPSRRIYGGTMAPLLKKRPVKEKKKVIVASEDKIENKMKLDDYGYRFHGTNAPRSIGRNQSHGCVRMIPADAKKVAELIKEHVGVASRQESENGAFVVLKAPVRLNLIK